MMLHNYIAINVSRYEAYRPIYPRQTRSQEPKCDHRAIGLGCEMLLIYQLLWVIAVSQTTSSALLSE